MVDTLVGGWRGNKRQAKFAATAANLPQASYALESIARKILRLRRQSLKAAP
jgi:hypothetical protein